MKTAGYQWPAHQPDNFEWDAVWTYSVDVSRRECAKNLKLMMEAEKIFCQNVVVPFPIPKKSAQNQDDGILFPSHSSTSSNGELYWTNLLGQSTNNTAHVGESTLKGNPLISCIVGKIFSSKLSSILKNINPFARGSSPKACT